MKTTKRSIVKHLLLMLKGFEEDPADSEFQYGYKAAIEELLENIELERI